MTSEEMWVSLKVRQIVMSELPNKASLKINKNSKSGTDSESGIFSRFFRNILGSDKNKGKKSPYKSTKDLQEQSCYDDALSCHTKHHCRLNTCRQCIINTQMIKELTSSIHKRWETSMYIYDEKYMTENNIDGLFVSLMDEDMRVRSKAASDVRIPTMKDMYAELRAYRAKKIITDEHTVALVYFFAMCNYYSKVRMDGRLLRSYTGLIVCQKTPQGIARIAEACVLLWISVMDKMYPQHRRFSSRIGKIDRNKGNMFLSFAVLTIGLSAMMVEGQAIRGDPHFQDIPRANNTDIAPIGEQALIGKPGVNACMSVPAKPTGGMMSYLFDSDETSSTAVAVPSVNKVIEGVQLSLTEIGSFVFVAITDPARTYMNLFYGNVHVLSEQYYNNTVRVSLQENGYRWQTQSFWDSNVSQRRDMLRRYLKQRVKADMISNQYLQQAYNSSAALETIVLKAITYLPMALYKDHAVSDTDIRNNFELDAMFNEHFTPVGHYFTNNWKKVTGFGGGQDVRELFVTTIQQIQAETNVHYTTDIEATVQKVCNSPEDYAMHGTNMETFLFSIYINNRDQPENLRDILNTIAMQQAEAIIAKNNMTDVSDDIKITYATTEFENLMVTLQDYLKSVVDKNSEALEKALIVRDLSLDKIRHDMSTVQTWKDQLQERLDQQKSKQDQIAKEVQERRRRAEELQLNITRDVHACTELDNNITTLNNKIQNTVNESQRIELELQLNKTINDLDQTKKNEEASQQQFKQTKEQLGKLTKEYANVSDDVEETETALHIANEEFDRLVVLKNTCSLQPTIEDLFSVGEVKPWTPSEWKAKDPESSLLERWLFSVQSTVEENPVLVGSAVATIPFAAVYAMVFGTNFFRKSYRVPDDKEIPNKARLVTIFNEEKTPRTFYRHESTNDYRIYFPCKFDGKTKTIVGTSGPEIESPSQFKIVDGKLYNTDDNGLDKHSKYMDLLSKKF